MNNLLNKIKSYFNVEEAPTTPPPEPISEYDHIIKKSDTLYYVANETYTKAFKEVMNQMTQAAKGGHNQCEVNIEAIGCCNAVFENMDKELTMLGYQVGFGRESFSNKLKFVVRWKTK